MSLTPFDNPLDRLGVNPTGMNWRSLWSATEQYYLNDVVVAPLNNASYILAGKTTLLDGGDPSTNPDWVELSLPTTGVVSVTALPNGGITVTDSTTNPVISNDGVLTVTTGVGINNVGTAQNPILTNTGLVALTAGAGIQYTAGFPYPTITNTGIRTITQGSGISVSTGPNPTIGNTGLLDITIPPNSGLATTGGQNPTLTNTGVLSLTVGVGSGIQNVGTAQDPILQNSGVTQILGGTGIATSTNIGVIGQEVLVTATIFPRLSYLDANKVGILQLLQPTDSFYFSINNFSTKIAQDFLNGPPNPNGVWLMDFSPITFFCPTYLPTSGGTIDISVSKTNFNPPPLITYNIPETEGGTIPVHGYLTNQVTWGMGPTVFNIEAMRSIGITYPNRITFTNNTSQPIWINANTFRFFGTYYPFGIE